MRLDWYLKWVATFTLIAGAILTSMDVRPLNIWMFNTANVVWIVVGIMWREASLIVMNSVLVAIYGYGLLFTFR